MNCPACGYAESKVVDSRPVNDGASIRRRRECLQCQKRFTTFEMLESMQIMVVKKDGSKELFDKQKLLSGLLKACQKRPVNAEEIVAEIESELQNSLSNDVTTVEIGEMVMDKLKKRDEVAYVRFASVYREFKDIDSFMEVIKSLFLGLGYINDVASFFVSNFKRICFIVLCVVYAFKSVFGQIARDCILIIYIADSIFHCPAAFFIEIGVQQSE